MKKRIFQHSALVDRKIEKLRIDGFSLKEITKRVPVSYFTVKRRCKRIKMSKKGKERYHSKVNGVVKKFKIKKRLTKEKVRIISNLLFDGAVYKNKGHYSIMYVNSSKELIKQFVKDMKKVYNTNSFSFENHKTYYRIKYHSKQIYNDLISYCESFSTSNKKCSFPFKMLNKSRLFKIIILRAFWENEGSISNEGKLSADLKSLKVIKQLSRLHHNFGIKYGICRYKCNGWMYKLFLSKSRENYQKFLDLKLFSKAQVTRGQFIGKKKIDVLKRYFNNRFA